MKDRLGLVGFAFVLGVSIAAAPQLAHAAVYSAPAAFVTSNGVTYTHYSQGTDSKLAYTDLQADRTVATGWLGTNPQLWVQSSGALCKSGGWTYNSGPSISIGTFTSSGVCGAQYYFARGQVRGWDGVGYILKTTNSTPAIYYS